MRESYGKERITYLRETALQACEFCFLHSSNSAKILTQLAKVSSVLPV